MDDCIFCKIVAGQIPSNKVHEDDELIAFNDINPAAPLHLLVVPREHVATLADCNGRHQALLGKMMLLASKLAADAGSGITVGDDGRMAGGFRTVFNAGPGGGQEVYHLHLHVLGGTRPWRNFP